MEVRTAFRGSALPKRGLAAALMALIVVTGGLLAIAFANARLSASHNSNAAVSVGAVGAELIAHNRSEQGLGVTRLAAAQQIPHNQSVELVP